VKCNTKSILRHWFHGPNGLQEMGMRTLIGMWIIRYMNYVQNIINCQIQTWQLRVPFRSFITDKHIADNINYVIIFQKQILQK